MKRPNKHKEGNFVTYNKAEQHAYREHAKMLNKHKNSLKQIKRRKVKYRKHDKPGIYSNDSVNRSLNS